MNSDTEKTTNSLLRQNKSRSSEMIKDADIYFIDSEEFYKTNNIMFDSDIT